LRVCRLRRKIAPRCSIQEAKRDATGELRT
jgi:hypothetical protein